MAVTLRLLSESDPRSVTLDQISESAGVAKSSILWHFGSKEELILDALDRLIRDFEQSLYFQYPDGLDPMQKLRRLFEDFAGWMQAHSQLFGLFFAFVFDHALRSSVRGRAQAMYRGYRATIAHHMIGLVEEGRDEIATAIIGLLDGVFIQWLVDPQAVDPMSVFDVLLEGVESSLERSRSTRS